MKLILAIGLFFASMGAICGQQVASVTANSRAISMNVFSGYVAGVGPVDNFVTTYDGQSGIPLHQSLSDGSALFSGELRARIGTPGVYEADYVTYDYNGDVVDYGSFTANLPTTDSDGNGLPDVAQANKAGNTGISGTSRSDVSGVVSSVTGYLSRAANAAVGSYSINVASPGVAAVAYNGTLNLLNVSGSMTYSRDTSTATFNLTEVFQYGVVRVITGSTQFSVPNANQVSFPQFNLSSSDGFTYTVMPFTATRSGNRYVGNLQLADGGPETYWRDYVSWVFEITDANDLNHNRVPDLSDPIPLVPEATPTPLYDFNGDGEPDYLLYNVSTRQTAVWYLNNNAFVAGTFAPTLPAGWRVVGVADFNGDSQPDYLLFNASTRQTAIWYLSGTTFVSGAFGPSLPSGWELVMVSDFNADNQPDYLLYNAGTGQTAIWYLNNNMLMGGAFAPTLPANWRVVSVADFNGDSQPDYLLFNASTRQTAIWYLSGPTLISGAYGPMIASGYTLIGAADFNADGKPDYALYSSAVQRTAVWYLNNNALTSGAFGPSLPANWSLTQR